MAKIELFDDGTLDTVLCCSECGEEFRFNFQMNDDPNVFESEAKAYDEFVDECIEQIEAEHECSEGEENPREKGDDDGIEYADPRDERDERNRS